MEKCKFCDAELEEGVTLCPSCGKENMEAEAEMTVEEPTAEEIQAAEETVEETSAETEGAAEEETAEEEPAAEETPDEEKEAPKKATPGKIALAVVAVVLLLALIIALLVGGMGGSAGTETTAPVDAEASAPVETEETVPPTTPADTGLNDETHKGTYSVSDEEAIAGADTVIATMGDKTLTNAQLQVYYWSYVGSYLGSEYGYQAMMYGLVDLAKPLDTQISVDGTTTWQQYFLRSALQNWHSVQAMALEAEAAGYTISEENQIALDAIPANLEAMLENYGVEDVQTLLAMNMGAGVDVDDFTHYQKIYFEGVPYYTDAVEKFAFTEEEIEAFFTENEEAYAQQGLTRDETVVDVRHTLIMPEGATSETIRTETFSDEAWAAAEQEAKDLLAAWEKGDKTEESFAQMANENTDDGNDSDMDGNPDGGLYTGITKGQMVEAFENWCFDETRQTGDYGIVKTEFGYHIMYFVKGEAVWPYYAEQDLRAKTENEFLQKTVDAHPIEVDYSAISLAVIAIQ